MATHQAKVKAIPHNVMQAPTLIKSIQLRSIHTSVNVCVCVCVCIKLQHYVYEMLRQTQRMAILCICIKSFASNHLHQIANKNA